MYDKENPRLLHIPFTIFNKLTTFKQVNELKINGTFHITTVLFNTFILSIKAIWY